MNRQSWLHEALSILESNRGFVFATVIGPPGHPLTGRHIVAEPGEAPSVGELESGFADPAAWSQAVQSVFLQRSGRLLSFEFKSPGPAVSVPAAQVFLTYCGPPPEAWIFGAGHIACALSPILARLGWRVIVCDDRTEFVSTERFPEAAELYAEAFEASARTCARRAEAWIVLVTRGHQHDLRILQEYSTHRSADERRSTPYIGMIGSRRRVGTVRRQLSNQGFPLDLLNVIQAPIGLPIGADTPAEIAISIASEMVAIRRGFRWDRTMAGFRRETEEACDSADTAGRLDLWRRVAEAVSGGNRVALATIVERRGSTPRGLGAQMAVFGNGSALGTIGGGCGESIVLRAAREMLLGNGEPCLLSVDLTGDQSSEATDVCGGRYVVFLEVVP